MSDQGKLVIFSAPSGAGKTTLVHSLLDRIPELAFSISATSRPARGKEKNGVDYYFLEPDEFRQKIESGAFAEWEEVYKDTYYGTLKSEIKRLFSAGKHVIFDIDVQGGLSLKKKYGKRALSIYVQAPSEEELYKRLKNRSTDSPEKIAERIAKAREEAKMAVHFDYILVNNDLEEAKKEAFEIVRRHLELGSY